MDSSELYPLTVRRGGKGIFFFILSLLILLLTAINAKFKCAHIFHRHNTLSTFGRGEMQRIAFSINCTYAIFCVRSFVCLFQTKFLLLCFRFLDTTTLLSSMSCVRVFVQIAKVELGLRRQTSLWVVFFSASLSSPLCESIKEWANERKECERERDYWCWIFN